MLQVNFYEIKKPGIAGFPVVIGGRGGIRTPGTLSGTPVFKTGAINQLCHSSRLLFRKAVQM
jgi:hypothetical protein